MNTSKYTSNQSIFINCPQEHLLGNIWYKGAKNVTRSYCYLHRHLHHKFLHYGFRDNTRIQHELTFCIKFRKKIIIQSFYLGEQQHLVLYSQVPINTNIQRHHRPGVERRTLKLRVRIMSQPRPLLSSHFSTLHEILVWTTGNSHPV